MSKDEVQRIIDEVDEDGNGKLDYKEVGNVMLINDFYVVFH